MTETKTCRAAGTAGLSLIAFFILPNAGCGKQAAQGAARTPSPTVVVVVETAERRDVPIMLELAARTEAAATVEVRANVEGRLIEMSFKEGNMVQKGQLLFRIDPRRYEAAVQAAGPAVEKAEADLEMAREQQHWQPVADLDHSEQIHALLEDGPNPVAGLYVRHPRRARGQHQRWLVCDRPGCAVPAH